VCSAPYLFDKFLWSRTFKKIMVFYVYEVVIGFRKGIDLVEEMKKQKLVRDKIPEIYGLQKRHIADDKEYLRELIKKLQEEVDEFREDCEVEELADIIEVVYALAEFLGIRIEKLEEIRKEKAEKRGQFKKRLIWEQE